MAEPEAWTAVVCSELWTLHRELAEELEAGVKNGSSPEALRAAAIVREAVRP
jgi:hypothetical protein